MLAARLMKGGLIAAPVVRCSYSRVSPVTPIKPKAFQNVIWRSFSEDARQPRTYARRRTLKEIATQPTQGLPFQVGTAAVAGGALFGLGALAYYGLGLSNKSGFIDQSMVWPQYVKDRIKDTYLYLGGSLAFTAASAAAVFRSPVAIRFVSKSGLMALFVSMAALIGSGQLCRSIPYQSGFGPKQMAWVLHSSVMGAVLAPMCFLGGPILLRAAWYTAGVVGGLSAVAACAPSDKFLNMGAPLGMALGAVFVSSIGTYFLPPTTMMGAGLYSVAMYGGLLVFSGFLLYDTQRVVRAAETYPQYAVQPFDPVNAALSIYLDVINIFIRIATMLATGGSSKRK